MLENIRLFICKISIDIIIIVLKCPIFHKMNIGFDAKRAFNNFTGLGNYSRTLLETLAKYYPKNRYLLFTPFVKEDPRLDFLKEYDSFKIHTPSGFNKKVPALWRSYFIKEDILKEKIDIFHGLSHELPMKLPRGVKSVVTIHDLIHERYPEFYPFIDRKIYTAKFKAACEKADIVVAISEATKQDIVEFYKIEERKIKVIYQSCHPQFYLKKEDVITSPTSVNLPPRPRELGGAGSQYLLYVGTVNERKNLLGLVRAVEMLDKAVKIPLFVIGDGGAYFKKVKSYIHEKGLGNDVIFLKNVPFSDFPQIYRNAKALILPSFQEGFGIPIIEALWSDCPVITSVGSCFPEAAGPDSIYINPHKPHEIAAAIDKVLSNEVVRGRMILRGYEYVQQFHEKTIGEQWMKLYKEL